MATKKEKTRIAKTMRTGPKTNLLRNQGKADVLETLKTALVKAKEKLELYKQSGDKAGVERTERIIQDTTSTIMSLQQQNARS